MNGAEFRAGFVAVVGRPNVGKSTLVNALVGSKVSIVTAKPQTTRHRILGVATAASSQAIFVDTPGLHRAGQKAMNRLMNLTALAAIADADVVLFVSEACRWTDDDADVLERLRKRLRERRKPVIAVLNKIDKVHPRDALLEALAELSSQLDFAELVPVSATRGTNIERLRNVLPAYLPESPPLFPAHMLSDRSPAFRAAEIIREKLMQALHQELPYGISVQVERYEEAGAGLDIDAVIWVERESQKGIVVGKGGRQLKQVGRDARLELREGTGVPVHLKLWVKVRDNWADSEADLAALGFDPV
ncbi:MAG TPA: GTPase Era [Woeseiaceae bacterium]|nr:GTPase Era [Woeseiaceae bacterium]